MAVNDKAREPDPWFEHAVFAATLDQRIAEMRRMLAAMKPGSTAGALRALRDAFPDIPLDERIRALTATRH